MTTYYTGNNGYIPDYVQNSANRSGVNIVSGNKPKTTPKPTTPKPPVTISNKNPSPNVGPTTKESSNTSSNPATLGQVIGGIASIIPGINNGMVDTITNGIDGAMQPNTGGNIVGDTTTDPTLDYINQLKASQLASRMAALNNMKNTSLTNLSNQEATIAPQYYDKRNQAAAASDVGAMNFAQYMASRGIKGSAGAMPEIYRQGGLNAEIGSLNRQEQAAQDQIARDKTAVENAYQNDIANANADVESQAMQSLIDQLNTNRQYDLQKAGLTGTLGGTRTLAGMQFDYSRDPLNPQNVAANLNNQILQKQLDAYQDPSKQQSWDNAMSLWQTLGRATPEISAILGVPTNASTADYDMTIRQLNEQAAARKASAEAKTANANPYSNIDNSADYQYDYNDIIQNPQGAVADLTANSQAYMQKYGVDGYNKLLTKAQEVDPDYVPPLR